eukprot:CAMPEP_0170332650 /NCGR_PEP_ID=MMETSP0116_2-20130129/67332_1 /TAXON_ID=400756 /ORGANISM="Durinskia baltica, Strain CSIRO CS-38" /LENGTH=127 /DNA_ID=CAMNT_0010585967 /DNA_START=252 /DNA_END=631 /DNA_ORIENTATION=+
MSRRQLGLRCWGATSCMVFDKTFRLSQSAAVIYGPGKISNISQVDSERFQWAFYWLHFLWSMPLMLIIGLSLLYVNIGLAAFSPLLVMALMYFTNKLVIKRFMDLDRQVCEGRDRRVKLLTEVMHAL